MKLLLGVLVTSLYVQLVTSDWELVWSDEFDGNSIDFTKWSHEITQGGGGVSQLVDQMNARVSCTRLLVYARYK